MWKRRQAIEALRITAAFGIVYYHTFASPGHDAAYAGLVAFITLSGYFAAQRPAEHNAFRHAMRRLLVPWAIWFAIYAVINRHAGVSMTPPGPVGILIGSSIHLWYLPWAFVCILLTKYARQRLSSTSCATIATSIAIIATMTASEWRPVSFVAGPPWAEYLHATAPFCWGVVLAQPPMSRRRLQIAGLFMSLVPPLVYGEGSSLVMPYAIGLTLCIVAVSIENANWPNWLRVSALADATYGIYLGHILAFHVLAHSLPEHTPAMALSSFILSAIGTWIWQSSGKVMSSWVVAWFRRSRPRSSTQEDSVGAEVLLP